MSGGAWFRQAVELARKHPQVLLPWIGVFVLEALAGPLNLSDYPRLRIAMAVLWLVLESWASATTLFYLEEAKKGENPSLDVAAGRGLGRTPRLIGLYLVELLLVGILTVVPAALAYVFLPGRWGVLILLWLPLFLAFVFLSVRLALAEAALVLGGTTITNALTASWSATRAAFFPIFGLLVRVVLLGGLARLLSLIPEIGPLFKGLGSAAVSYLATAGTGYAYLELRSAAEAGPGPAAPPSEGEPPA